MDDLPRDFSGRFDVREEWRRPTYREGERYMLRHHAKCIGDMARRASSATPRHGLEAFRALRYHCERLELFAVLNARQLGWSWKDIGESLGMSKQAAQKRYAQFVPRPRQRRPRY